MQFGTKVQTVQYLPIVHVAHNVRNAPRSAFERIPMQISDKFARFWQAKRR